MDTVTREKDQKIEALTREFNEKLAAAQAECN